MHSIFYGSQNRQWCLSTRPEQSNNARVNSSPGWSSWRAERRRSRCLDPALINSVKSRGVHATSQTSCVCQTNLLHARIAVKPHPASLDRHHIFTCGAELSLRVRDTRRGSRAALFLYCASFLLFCISAFPPRQYGNTRRCKPIGWVAISQLCF